MSLPKKFSEKLENRLRFIYKENYSEEYVVKTVKM